MKDIKPDKYTIGKKYLCDWTDEKKSFILYRMLKFYVRHETVVEKIHEILSFGQSKWLGKYMNFNTQKQNQALNDFEKDFCKKLIFAFYVKTTEKSRNRSKFEFIEKYDKEKFIEHQSN